MNTHLARHKRALVWSVTGLVAVGIGAAVLVRPPSLEQVARGGIAAVESGDSGTLVRSMTRAEVAALRLDERNLSRFLQGFVRPRMAGFVRTGAARITPFPESRQLIAEQDYVHPDGRLVVVSFTAASTPDGPRLVSAIASVTLSILRTDLPPGDALPGGRAKHAFWGQALQRALPELASTGVTGLVRQGTRSGKDEVYTFEEFALESQRKGASTPAPRRSGG